MSNAIGRRRQLRGLLALSGLLLGVTAGCHKATPTTGRTEQQAETTAPGFHIVKPERKTVSHRIDQPGFNIEAFQETPLYARISGYVKQWKADIGDHINKGDLLAELDVPEMVVAVRQKEAAIRQAEAQVKQAEAAVLSAEAQQARAKRQYERLARVGKTGVIDRENVDEVRLGYEAAKAGLEKAKADVTAAEAKVEVTKADRDYAQTMLQFSQLRAPYKGIVTRRMVSEGDFVQPAGTGAKGQPLYVVQQIDPVRIFVNVPGADALWLRDGDPVSFRLQGAGGELFTGKVTRNARSLEPQNRTLRTEIDIPNPRGKLLPGMYVQASISVKHPNVWTLPASAVLTEGDQTFCYRVEGGKAVRTLLQVGLRGGGLVEVIRKQVKGAGSAAEGQWQDFTGQEEVVSDPTGLSDGQSVQRSKSQK
jgi:multidrug efflux pump subunit AcrA (membrane-fusion protein)